MLCCDAMSNAFQAQHVVVDNEEGNNNNNNNVNVDSNFEANIENLFCSKI